MARPFHRGTPFSFGFLNPLRLSAVSGARERRGRKIADNRTLLIDAYRPVLRGFFAVAAVYYAIMTAAHFAVREGAQLFWFSAISIATVIATVAGFFLLRRLQRPLLVDLLVLGIDVLVLLNVLISLEMDFDRAKLSYFFVMSMIFAFSGPSMRQTFPAILMAMAALFAEVLRHVPEALPVYAFIGFASTVSSVAIAAFLRHSLLVSAAERNRAQERNEAAERLAELAQVRARTDSLTGMPNRRDFFTTFATHIEAAASAPPPGGLWLVTLDLDGFKGVNDNFGHLTGDELLREVARRIDRFRNSETYVARLGGDEFGVLLSASAEDFDMQRWSDDLVAALGRRYEIDGNVIRIGASVGCKRWSPGESVRRLLEHADYALLHAKRSRSCAVIFSAGHAHEMEQRFLIDQAVRAPDFASDLRVYFQPIVDLATGATTGAEALLRWHSPVLGYVSPERVVAVAEDAGLITDVTLHLLDRSLNAAAAWPGDLTLSINLSHMDIMSEEAVHKLLEVARRSHLFPNLLMFEITENALIYDTETAARHLRLIADAGHRIALDDFGTGYANYDVLRKLPVHRLKLDRSLIHSPADPVARELARSIAALGGILGLHTTVEGIETPEQLDLARTIGADSGQGFLFGRAMPQGKFLRHILQRGQQDADQDQPRKSAATGQ